MFVVKFAVDPTIYYLTQIRVAEKNMVRLSMFLVLIALAFVYLVFADAKPEILTSAKQEILVADKQGEKIVIVDDTPNTLDNPNYTEQDLLAKIKWIDNQMSWSLSKSLVLLSWTTITYNELDSLTKLWLKPKYILKGRDDIYFVNIGKWEIELSFRVSKYNGTIKTITDLAEIKKNGFNFLIMNYLNVPSRKESLVVFTTKQNTDNRLIQVPKAIYYKEKKYISDTLNSGY